MKACKTVDEASNCSFFLYMMDEQLNAADGWKMAKVDGLRNVTGPSRLAGAFPY